MALTLEQRKAATAAEVASLANPPIKAPAANQDDKNQKSQPVDNTTVPYSLKPNLLKEYSSFTPLVSFQVTTPQKYNNMMLTQKYNPADWNIICQSGGVGPIKTSVPGSDTKYFARDLFIDDFEMHTITGLNQQNRGSNVTDLSWTIVEPNGMDLIEELFDFCKELGEDNYTKLPYLIKLSFRGYKDDGTSDIIAGTTKYIPIILLNMEIKAQSTGSTYKVTAVPYNETSNFEACGRVDSNIETWGATVADFCGFLTWALNEHQKQYVKDGTYEFADQYEVIGIPMISSEKNGGTIDIGSYLVVNPVWSNTIVAKDSKMGDPASTGTQTIINNIASNIAGNLNPNTLKTTQVTENLPDGTTQTVNVTSISDSTDSANFSNQATVGGQLTGKNAIRFNAGSNIIDCINAIIINSSYITTQIKTYQSKIDNIITQANKIGPSAKDDSDIQSLITQLNYPFQWFMIIPQMQFLPIPTTSNDGTITIPSSAQYDHKRGCYAAKYTYYVQPYMIDNARLLAVPNNDPRLRVVKEYDYILTGKNTEILDFDMDFKFSFLTYAQSNINTKQQGSGSPTPAKDQVAPQSTQTSAMLVTGNTPINSPIIQVAAPNSAKNIGTAGEQSPERNTAADVAATIYAPAEMIQSTLKINGDPDYIKQDGLFVNPSGGSTLSPWFLINNNQGIQFNCGEIFINLNFLVPRDLNQSTGLIEKVDNTTTSFRRNVFSGQFKIIDVNNKINKGIFTQELQLIRINDSHNLEIVAPKPLTQYQQDVINRPGVPVHSAPQLNPITSLHATESTASKDVTYLPIFYPH